MHGATFLQDLAIVMMAAAVVTVGFHLLRLPVVLGYILAGVLIGPHVLPRPLISDETTIKTLSELGIVFLMFSLGLEFSFRRLRKVGTTIVLAEQNLHFCLGLADRAVVIDKGADVFVGTIRELNANDDIKQRYLSV